MTLIKKMLNLTKHIKWVYETPPNNFITGLWSVSKFIYWVVIKRFKKYIVGKYTNLNFIYFTNSGECGALYSHPYIDYRLHKFIDLSIKKDDIMFDVGSNIGNLSLLAGNKGAKVYSFEPNSKVMKIEKVNILINDLEENISTHKLLLSNTNGTETFYFQNDSLLSSMVFDQKNPGKMEQIHSITIDSFVEKNHIKNIDFLKIDVEGAELKVLEGSKQLLENELVKIIYWESNFKGSKDEREEVIEFIDKYHFKHFGFEIKSNNKILVRKWYYGDTDCISIQDKTLNSFMDKIKKDDTFILSNEF